MSLICVSFLGSLLCVSSLCLVSLSSQTYRSKCEQGWVKFTTPLFCHKTILKDGCCRFRCINSAPPIIANPDIRDIPSYFDFCNSAPDSSIMSRFRCSKPGPVVLISRLLSVSLPS
ncbi:hypothetical protein P152DRAFT_454122 [Eremomyces bilateralis CBS 781.70]|uniref:Secreted protein n=1 Tax=Eremomyces bilateralis CBS 781.70 TaxID=1392243 RepID=A0A6G1GHW0_9PEZI|nr:uncharacterized protein P152DRAFT_454122 [Eremomyces bilateralis CBS 781.70]KAF1817536.1 hypothetical protein P152DRAFT_454122 [Eremomyces bilateralis CBS 781.70]